MSTLRELRGTLHRADLGTGLWVLHTSDGQQLQLHGSVPAELAGRRVRVRGKDSEAYGFGMVGPGFEVVEISAL